MKNLIFHVPHASTYVPADVRRDIELDDAALAEELRLLTDHFTDVLFTDFLQPGDNVVACPVSRLVVDVERFADDAEESMCAQGMGAVYQRGHDGRVLRRNLKSRDQLLQRFYVPHHHALQQAVEKHLTEQGEAIIIDCHSFPEHALPYEKDQTLHRPEICIGTDSVHTSEALAVAIEQAYRDCNFEVARNTPFAGSLVPLAYLGWHKRVQSVMIEVRRDVYMNELTVKRKPDVPRFTHANADAIMAARRFSL